MQVGLWRRLSPENWCFELWCWRRLPPPPATFFFFSSLENTFESPLDSKEIKPVSPKGNQPWIFIVRTDGWSANPLPTWWEEPSHIKTLMLGKIEGRRRDNREWDGWMASVTEWTCVWANSGRWWRAGKPGVLFVSPWGCKESDIT